MHKKSMDKSKKAVIHVFLPIFANGIFYYVDVRRKRHKIPE